MSLFANAVERAERIHAADMARIEGIRAEIDRQDAAPTEDDSFDDLVAADAETQALRSKLVIAEGVAVRSAAALAAAREAEAAQALTVRRTALEREATAVAKRVRAMFEAQRKLAAERDLVAAHVAAVDAFNATRGDLPTISDGERIVREQPGEVVKEITQDDPVWTDANGNIVPAYVTNAEGRWVSNPAAREIGTRTSVIREAMTMPPTMPPRLADSIVLIDEVGRRL